MAWQLVTNPKTETKPGRPGFGKTPYVCVATIEYKVAVRERAGPDVHGPGLAQRTRQQTLHGPNQRIPARWRQGRQTKSSDAAGINAQGVPCYQGSCSEVYLEKAFDGTGWRPQDRFPVAKALGETTLMFLVHPTLTVDDMNRSVNAITSVLKEASR
jgi:hypothetical protein